MIASFHFFYGSFPSFIENPMGQNVQLVFCLAYIFLKIILSPHEHFRRNVLKTISHIQL